MSKLKTILEELDRKKIIAEIVLPCRKAQHSYMPKFPVPPTFHLFTQDCADYYNHLMMYALSKSASDIPFEHALSYAKRLINQMLEGQGGMKYAFYKAQNETFGTIKAIMTDVQIDQMTRDYMNIILIKHIDPYNYSELKELMIEYVKTFNVRVREDELPFLVQSYQNVLLSHVKREYEKEMDREMHAIMRNP